MFLPIPFLTGSSRQGMRSSGCVPRRNLVKQKEVTLVVGGSMVSHAFHSKNGLITSHVVTHKLINENQLIDWRVCP